MADMQELQALTEGVKPVIPIIETRFEASPTDLPFTPPPYSSMIDDALMDGRIHLRKDKLRQTALGPVRLKAGQSEPPSGGLGLHAVPVRLPELRGGRILSGRV